MTNSSSSSFIAIDVESKDFVELLGRFAKGLHNIFGDCLILDFDKNKMELEYEDGYCPDVPESLKGFVDSFIEFVEETSEIEICRSYGRDVVVADNGLAMKHSATVQIDFYSGTEKAAQV